MAKNYCPICDAYTDDEFCSVCGKKISESSTQTISVQRSPTSYKKPQTPSTPKRYCQFCGAELPSTNAGVCLQCGALVSSPPAQSTTYTTEKCYSSRSRLAAGLLGIFLGVFGIHNFYLGFTKKAVIQIILAFLSGGVISCIWGLVEGIYILASSNAADADGCFLQ